MIEDNKKKQLESFEKMIEPMITKISSLLGHLNILKSFFVIQLDQLIDNAKDWISNLQSLGLKLQEIKQLNDSLSTKIDSKLNLFRLYEEYQKCQQILQELSSQIYSQSQLPQSQSIQCASQFKSFNYQIIKDNSVNQIEWCSVIGYNKDCSYVVVGCGKQIKTQEFKQSQINFKNGQPLTFIKKFIEFILGDYGGSILSCSNNNINQWYCSQIIKAHNHSIQCLILNNYEDHFISSSGDNTIKSWVKKNDWICQQTITHHKDWINQLSLDDQENIVISSGKDKQILVIESFKLNKMWIVFKSIKVEFYGYRICFINNNQFTFQLESGSLMNVYQINNISKEQTKTKDITVNHCNNSNQGELFPQQLKKKTIISEQTWRQYQFYQTNKR
ncbi:unnamed protein product [Paramecium octaurelia]|uniref:Uncharacterized protein n=1 Tax=Paramecium octaurelia TaxID=43137 RepID=A0A8S1U0N2_PAROT|nr:unnamed protein product [Paramecium octaurelia]